VIRCHAKPQRSVFPSANRPGAGGRFARTSSLWRIANPLLVKDLPGEFATPGGERSREAGEPTTTPKGNHALVWTLERLQLSAIPRLAALV
jgi:hypothetical protein